jgi:hypothetical protein
MMAAETSDAAIEAGADDVATARDVENLGRRYRALLTALREPPLSADQAVWDEIAGARQALDAARAQQQAQRQDAERPARETAGGALGTLLGPETTGLKVTTALRLQPIPTGIYHLLDPATNPLLIVTVQNETHEPRRVCISAYLEGISAQAIQTIELTRMDKGKTIKLLPSLLPGPARLITQVQRGTLHVIVTIYGSTRDTWSQLVESHDTQSVLLLSRNTSFNSVIDPQTGLPPDLVRYYGAWVTPHIEPIQALLRRAAELTPEQQIWGYQGDPDVVPRQVEALYNALKVVGITYVNSVIDFGAGPGLLTQRTRLPRESLKHRVANCIDGTVLFASLLESASLHAGIVLVPGHAFVSWEKWPGTDQWDYLETTMIATHDFAAANAYGRDLAQKWFSAKSQAGADSGAQLLSLNDLRAEGVWPME